MSVHGKDTTPYARDPFVEQFTSSSRDDAEETWQILLSSWSDLRLLRPRHTRRVAELYSPNIDKKKVLDMS